MGMKVFSRLSKVFKSKNREPGRQATVTVGPRVEKTVRYEQLKVTVEQIRSPDRAQRTPIGRSKSHDVSSTSGPRLVSQAKRSISWPAAKQVHRPKAVVPSGEAPIIKRAKPAQLAAAIKNEQFSVDKRAHPHGVQRLEFIRVRSLIGHEARVKHGEDKVINWVATAGTQKGYGKQAKAQEVRPLSDGVPTLNLPLVADDASQPPRVEDLLKHLALVAAKSGVAGTKSDQGLTLVPVKPQAKVDPWEALCAELADAGILSDGDERASDAADQVQAQAAQVAQPEVLPAWSEVADEHKSALRDTLFQGIHGDKSPAVMDLWLELGSRFQDLGWETDFSQDKTMAALFDLDVAKRNDASSAIAMAWVCAFESDLWREKNGGQANLALENNPYFFTIVDKVEAYMRAHHSDAYRAATSTAALASPIAISAPGTDSRIASELDDLIADFENMAWPQNAVGGAKP